MPIDRLKAEHMQDARDRFTRMPKNIQQTKKYSGKSLREFSEMDISEGGRLRKQTLDDSAVKVGGFLNRARERRFWEPLKNAAPISEKRDAIEIERGRFLLDQNFLGLLHSQADLAR